MNRHILLEQTEEGKTLNLSFEQEHNCKVVYKKSEEEGKYSFNSLWEPEHEYSDEYLIVPLRSVFDSIFDYQQNWVFANIVGSSGDPKHSYESWKALLENHGVDCSNCATDEKFYISSNDMVDPSKHCGGIILGGHVVLGRKNESPPKGSTVYLIPICHNHNSCSTAGGSGPGTGFYMKTRTNGKAICLRSYFQYT
jgi:hypothetical protein